MFLPIKDENPLRIIPFEFINVTLIGASVIVFLWQLSLPGGQSVLSFGMIPAVLFETRHLSPDLYRVPSEATLLTSMFLHGSWMHLIGNMLFLWIFGDNVEDSMGHARYLLFYLLCGVAGSLAHAAANPDSLQPVVGASGAISGVMGAYLMLHPRVKVLVLALFRIPVHLPAYIVLGCYFLLQILYVVTDTGGNTALWAHIGGFIAGALLITVFRDSRVPLFDRGIRH